MNVPAGFLHILSVPHCEPDGQNGPMISLFGVSAASGLDTNREAGWKHSNRQANSDPGGLQLWFSDAKVSQSSPGSTKPFPQTPRERSGSSLHEAASTRTKHTGAATTQMAAQVWQNSCRADVKTDSPSPWVYRYGYAPA